jgi:hypothetical protein
MQSTGDRIRIVGRDEQAAVGFVHNLNEGAATRLHDGHTGGHRLEQKHPFRLVVGGRHRQDIEVAQKCKLGRAIDCAAIDELVSKSCALEAGAGLVQIPLVVRRHVPRNVEDGRTAADASAKADVRLGEQMQPLLGRDAREVADTKWPR